MCIYIFLVVQGNPPQEIYILSHHLRRIKIGMQILFFPGLMFGFEKFLWTALHLFQQYSLIRKFIGFS